MSRARATLLALIVAALVLAAGAGLWLSRLGRPEAPPPEPPAPEPTGAEPSPEAKRLDQLVRVALDRGRPSAERVEAILSLQEARAVDHLLQLLPPAGDYDMVTVIAIAALGELGDRRAVPALQRIYEVHPPGLFVHGEFWANLSGVIDHLDQPPGGPRVVREGW